VFGQERSPEDYARLAGSYAININLTMRTSGVRIATGRSFETPLVGSLLLEEANEDTAYFRGPLGVVEGVVGQGQHRRARHSAADRLRSSQMVIANKHFDNWTTPGRCATFTTYFEGFLGILGYR